MSSCDLLAEVVSGADQIRRRHFDRLADLGVTSQAIGTLGQYQHTIGAMNIRDVSGGLFEPDPAGFGACIVAVIDPWAELGDAGIYDLVAFRADDPSRWWCRTGLAFALGEDALDLPEPVLVVRTPADWLAVAGEAVCILDWSEPSPAWPALRSGPPLRFTDESLRDQVRNALVRWAPMPTMEMAA